LLEKIKMIMPRKYVKLFALLLAVALTAIAVFEIHESYVQRVEYEFYRQHIGPHIGHHSILNVKDSSHICHLPVYDPFDPTILSYFKKCPTIACGTPQFPLTYMDNYGTIHLNGTAIKEAGLEEKEFHCALYEIIRKPNNDDHYELGPPKVQYYNFKAYYYVIKYIYPTVYQYDNI
jgi:hypothetical protein